MTQPNTPPSGEEPNFGSPYPPQQPPPPGSQPGYPPSGPPSYAGTPPPPPPPPGYYPPQPGAPYGVDPVTGQPYSSKSKIVAGVLGIAFGTFGAGRFYTGYTGLAVAQLVVSILTAGCGSIWGIIDGIIILVKGGTDSEGRPLRD